MRRVNVYQETYNRIMDWGKEKMMVDIGFIPPNNKPNFPFFLEKIIEEARV